ncbi:hypothetical protein ACFLT9_13170 [Acidobacteriota bacterium]
MSSKKRTVLYFLCGWIFFLPANPGEVIDRIAAVVADEVITLTDVRIAREFGIYDTAHVPIDTVDTFILNKLIDQKLVIQMTDTDVEVLEEDLDEAVRLATFNLGEEQTRLKFLQFGIDWEDLKESFRENLLYQNTLFQRFSRSAFVGLREIETYYRETYVPEQQSREVDPLPMLDVLNDIEAAIKRAKIAEQVDSWIENLRLEADIQILFEK